MIGEPLAQSRPAERGRARSAPGGGEAARGIEPRTASIRPAWGGPALGPEHRLARGFTLLEVAVVLAITGILLAVAVPNYSRLMQRQQLRGAADALLQDLRNAREESVRTRTGVFVSYRAGKSWCWGVSSGQPCDCSGTSPLPACRSSRGQQADYPDVRLDSADDLAFEPKMGQAPLHGSVKLSTAKGSSLRVDLNSMGRAQLCGPDAQTSTPC